MNEVLNGIKIYGDWFVYIAGLVYLYVKVVRPIKGVYTITSLLLWSSLVREHDHFMRVGYCPVSDKKRLCDLHKEYRARGLNHLADEWEKDIIDLPDNPKEGCE